MNDGQMENLLLHQGVEWLNEFFPGLKYPMENPFDIINLLLSKQPDSKITSKVAADGGYDPCGGVSK